MLHAHAGAVADITKLSPARVTDHANNLGPGNSQESIPAGRSSDSTCCKVPVDVPEGRWLLTGAAEEVLAERNGWICCCHGRQHMLDSPSIAAGHCQVERCAA